MAPQNLAFKASGLASHQPASLGLSLAEIVETVTPLEPHSTRLEHPFPPWRQGSLPACVSCSIATAMEILDARRGGATRLSPLFNYWVSRPISSMLSDVELPTALLQAQEGGICRHSLHQLPFTVAGAKTQPLPSAFDDARNHRLVLFGSRQPGESPFRYFALSEPENPQSWKTILARGFPLILGFRMSEDYDTMTKGRPYLASASATGALHAVTVVGYDSGALDGGALRIKDSRGRAFGDRGEWWFPFRLLSTPIVDQAWALTEISYDT